ncbi:cytochrome C [bacterium]|nr:cytochrome C [bacterium]MBU1433742.1 cytochrome C [bacterium]MBU1503817.1 cytochrome C [bacterium]
MKKSTFILLSCISLCSVELSASVYKGHGLFKNMCLECHGKALEFVINKNTKQWNDLLKDNASALVLIHLKAPEAQKSLEYFKGERFPKHIVHYKDFFSEYASDTGNVPACD